MSAEGNMRRCSVHHVIPTSLYMNIHFVPICMTFVQKLGPKIVMGAFRGYISLADEVNTVYRVLEQHELHTMRADCHHQQVNQCSYSYRLALCGKVKQPTLSATGSGGSAALVVTAFIWSTSSGLSVHNSLTST